MGKTKGCRGRLENPKVDRVHGLFDVPRGTDNRVVLDLRMASKFVDSRPVCTAVLHDHWVVASDRKTALWQTRNLDLVRLFKSPKRDRIVFVKTNRIAGLAILHIVNGPLPFIEHGLSKCDLCGTAILCD